MRTFPREAKQTLEEEQQQITYSAFKWGLSVYYRLNTISAIDWWSCEISVPWARWTFIAVYLRRVEVYPFSPEIAAETVALDKHSCSEDTLG